MRKGGRGRTAGGGTEAQLKEVMRLFPQGVTVVTTQTKHGPRGLTVSSFISVSLDPPLVLVSLGRGSDLHGSFVRAKSFAVNFLAADQKSVSERFAGKVEVKERFDGISTHKGVTGSPIIDGVRAAIECRVWRVYDGGDHSLVLGEVVRASATREARPLVYYAQRYATIEGSKSPSKLADRVQ
jgi:flavin reductase (DIM6/NTAB) family NADH-FMN oxidoreductase RutF